MLFRINNQSIVCEEHPDIVENSRNIYEATFEFSGGWEGYRKIAVFKRAGDRDQPDGYAREIEGSAINVPSAVLARFGTMRVGVLGIMGDKVKPTIWTDPITILDGVNPTDVLPDPEPSVLQFILDLIDQKGVPDGGSSDQVLHGDKTWKDLNKESVGLGNVDNTSDEDKPISTAVQAALDNLIRGIGEEFENKANVPEYRSATLAAAGWVGNEYNLEGSYPIAEYDIEVSLLETATQEQADAYTTAMLVGVFRRNKIKAFGDVPGVDIPVQIKVVSR